MILHNGRILTLHPVLSESAALAIAGGRVLGGVDSREDAIASHAHERIDLDGLFVVPGFVDSHMHFVGWAAAATQPDVSSATTHDQMLAILSTAANDSSQNEDEWLIARGFRPSLRPHSAELLATLDSAFTAKPIAIISADGHMLLLNTAAINALGVDSDHTGLFVEQAAMHIRQQLPDTGVNLESIYRATRTAAKLGITSVHDMDGSATFRWMQQLDDERGLPVRVWQHFSPDELPALERLGIRSGFGRDRLRIGGIKMFADGTLSSGTAWLHHPETKVRAGSSAPTQGTQLLTTGQIADVARRAGALGLPILVHAIGDGAVTATIDALEATQGHWTSGSDSPRPRIEHAQLITDTDIQRCVELGIAVSMQPAHIQPDQPFAQRYWSDRLDNAYRMRDIVDAGGLVITGSDAPIASADPLETLRAARNGGSGTAPWLSHQALSGDEALAAATIGPAIATGTSRYLGRLMPGYQADLAVLTENPRTSDTAEVIATMVAGRWTFGRGNLR